MRRVLSLWRGELVVSGTTWKDTARAVADKHGLTLAELLGPSRVRKVAHARQEAMALVHHEHKLSTVRVGQLFGGRDHTTVLHALKQVTARAEAA
jgi:chromosomal replication initiation ATPase DnaA